MEKVTCSTGYKNHFIMCWLSREMFTYIHLKEVMYIFNAPIDSRIIRRTKHLVNSQSAGNLCKLVLNSVPLSDKIWSESSNL